MSTETAGLGDTAPIAQLVDCTPPPDADAPLAVDLNAAPEESPVAHAHDATIEVVGAGPPPEGDR